MKNSAEITIINKHEMNKSIDINDSLRKCRLIQYSNTQSLNQNIFSPALTRALAIFAIIILPSLFINPFYGFIAALILSGIAYYYHPHKSWTSISLMFIDNYKQPFDNENYQWLKEAIKNSNGTQKLEIPSLIAVWLNKEVESIQSRNKLL